MVQRGLSSFRPADDILTHETKVWKHEAKLSVCNFFKRVKIISVGLKLDRPQLQHWLLFLKHNRLRSKDLNVVAGLPVPLDFDCVCDSV